MPANLNEIKNFLEDYSGVHQESADTDILLDMGVSRDDFDEMIEKYAEKYQVDMSGYLWYFHSDEEGFGMGRFFFKPPYERVKRIPVTPKMLADFAVTKKWKIEYPHHKVPEHRPDLAFNKASIIVFLVILIIWGVISIFN